MVATVRRTRRREAAACYQVYTYLQSKVIAGTLVVAADRKGRIFRIYFDVGSVKMLKEVLLPECRRIGKDFGVKVKGKEGARKIISSGVERYSDLDSGLGCALFEGYVISVHLSHGLRYIGEISASSTDSSAVLSFLYRLKWVANTWEGQEKWGNQENHGNHQRRQSLTR